jgi:hypothetical protein
MYRRILLVAFLIGLWAIPVSAQTTVGPLGISDAADDGFEQGATWTAGTVFVGNDGASVHMGLRWRSVAVPQGATITSATIILIPRNAVTGTITDVHGEIAGHLGDAPVFANGVFSPNVGFSPTTARVQFDPTTWVVDDPDDQTYDVTTIVQEIVNGTWASGDDLAIRINNDGTTATNFARTWQFSDGNTPSSSSAGNKLTITYTTGGGGGGAAIGRNRRLLGVGR